MPISKLKAQKSKTQSKDSPRVSSIDSQQPSAQVVKAKGKTVSNGKTRVAKEGKVKQELSDKKVISQSPIKKSASKPASSMDELMTHIGGEISLPKRGQIIKGTITDITNRMILVDIGAKTEGMISEREFDYARDFIKSLAVGDTVQAYVLTPENDRGQILLSLRTAAEEWQWKKLVEWMKSGEHIDVRGLEVNKGGVVARIDSMDIQGFVPTSQLGSDLAKNLDDLINRVFKAKIIEVDRQNRRLIFSERAVSEEGEIQARKDILRDVTVGMKVTGKIVGLTDFGAFARISVNGHDVEGLIHISELSWEKVLDAKSVVKEGDDVDLVVIDVNPAAGKVGFSLKQRLADPWTDIESRYPPGKKLTGTVTKIASFGAFVQLEPGVSGLLHISKIPTKKEPKEGDEIEVVVEDLDSDHRRLALGMATEEAPVIYR